jgi:hypothetical protein
MEMDCFVASAFARRRASADKSAPRNDVERALVLISNSRCTSAISRREAPEVCMSLSLDKGGSRECRMRAAPAVSRAKKCQKTHTSIQVQRRTSDIPCAMALRLITRSPRRRIRLVTVAAGLTADRPGWIDFTTDSLTPATGAGTTRLHRTQPPVFAKRLRRAKAPFVCAPFDRSRVLAQSSTRPATHLRA